MMRAIFSSSPLFIISSISFNSGIYGKSTKTTLIQAHKPGVRKYITIQLGDKNDPIFVREINSMSNEINKLIPVIITPTVKLIG